MKRGLIWLLNFLLPMSKWILLSLVLGFATILCNIGLMGTSAYLISRASEHISLSAIQIAIVGVRFFGLSRGIFRYFDRLLSHSINFSLIGKLRIWFYARIEQLIPGQMDKHRSGEILAGAVSEINDLEQFYVRVVSPPIIALFTIVALTIFAGEVHRTLWPYYLVGFFISGFAPLLLGFFLSWREQSTFVECRSRLWGTLVDAIQGLADIVAFGVRDKTIKDFFQRNHCFDQIQFRRSFLSGVSNTVSKVIWQAFFIITLVEVISLVSNQSIFGYFLPVMVLMTLASFEALQPLGSLPYQLNISLQAEKNLNLLVDKPLTIREPSNPIPPPRVSNIEIRDLSFSYPQNSRYVLKDINLALPFAKRIAIVGPSGSGKTTLLNLLLRYWEYEHGKITLDGQDIRDYLSNDIRQKISIINQNTYIFNATLKQNLLIARPGCGDAVLLETLDKVGLMDWYRTLPDGLDTWLGEHGQKISMGERQRIGIARAIVREVRIFLIDEPTEHLDQRSAQQITRVLFQETTDKTVIWITHHLLLMELFDEIVVLRDGKIIERGKHKALIDERTNYYRIWQNLHGLLPNTFRIPINGYDQAGMADS